MGATCITSRSHSIEDAAEFLPGLEPTFDDGAFLAQCAYTDDHYVAVPDSDSQEVDKFIKQLSHREDAISQNTTGDVRKWKVWRELLLVFVGLFASVLVGLLFKGGWGAAWMASIPLVSTLFTWFHIWLAIQMMFLPLEFFGLWEHGQSGVGIGWRGIVPRKAHKMAKTSYRCARPHLEGPRDWLTRVDPQLLVKIIRPQLKQIIEKALVKLCRKHAVQERLSDTFQNLAGSALDEIEKNCPGLWNELVDLLSDKQIGIDNDGMFVKVFTESTETLNKFFMVLGEREFRFIEHCGAAMGFFCGILQLVGFNHLDPGCRLIFLPATGFFLGIATNWLAILMVFKPCYPHPVKLCGKCLFTVQGLFLRRQSEVCELYAKMLCEHFLIFDKVVDYLQTLPELWEKLTDAYVQFNTQVMRETVGFTASWLAPLALGQGVMEQFELDLQWELVEGLRVANEVHTLSGQYISKATDIERKNREALQRMPPHEFENILHPIFKEDEWILILLGGVLGAIVGFAQTMVLK